MGFLWIGRSARAPLRDFFHGRGKRPQTDRLSENGALGRGQPFRCENRPGGRYCRNDATPVEFLDIVVSIIDSISLGNAHI